MKMPQAVLRRVADSLAFRASAAGYLVLDSDLHICAANTAYEQATLHRSRDMVGEFMFDVFPDNPATPEAAAVANLERSLELVLRHGRPSRMGLQRYDVLDPSRNVFVNRSWLPVNSPIVDADGHTVAILHHVEDVSPLVRTTSLEDLVAEPPTPPPTVDPASRRDAVDRLVKDSRRRQKRADEAVTRSMEAMERLSRALSRSSSPRRRH